MPAAGFNVRARTSGGDIAASASPSGIEGGNGTQGHSGRSATILLDGIRDATKDPAHLLFGVLRGDLHHMSGL